MRMHRIRLLRVRRQSKYGPGVVPGGTNTPPAGNLTLNLKRKLWVLRSAPALKATDATLVLAAGNSGLLGALVSPLYARPETTTEATACAQATVTDWHVHSHRNLDSAHHDVEGQRHTRSGHLVPAH